MNNLSERNGAAHFAQPKFCSPLLINESPLLVLPGLAIAIGLNEAIVLQQLHYLLREPEFGRQVGDHKWIFNTFEEWKCRYFPFWSIRTIKTVFTNLSNLKLIVHCQPEGRISRRKYYRIDFEKLAALSDRAKFVPSIVQESSLPITKTTVQRESKETSFDKDESGKKESNISLERYPSEEEFEAFLQENECDEILNKRSDLYSDLCKRRWSDWNEARGKMVQIRDWRKYVLGLEMHMRQSYGSGRV